jgi:peptidoglycan/xylan/chitin deacetylase (PgdA/CDA1 family)
MIPQQKRYPYSPITQRRDYSWPNGKRLAFWIGQNVELYAFNAGIGNDPAKIGEPQNQRNFGWRDYGNRVGFWNLMDLYDEFKLPVSHIVNSLLYEFHPQLFDRIRARGDDIIGHGRTNAERQKGLWEIDEKRLIDDATREIIKHERKQPKGWLGAAASENATTLDLLKEAGYTYVLDWPCDDQPIWLATRSGPILSIPYPAELNDAASLIFRQHTGRQFAQLITDQFDEMVERSADRPMVYCLSLHPYICGQPHRIRALRDAFKYITEHKHRDRVWFTRGDELADYCYSLPEGLIP